ncbi:bis(5'-nucleosyl)-tetraphosphatase (symmetrical) YqeK [Paenibacillus sp. P96]|uniref:bis(5'-nucleosyl)-tetraphosphatase (symmetrical) n=1 Tax=Paenibacillus zeirhizosphaerae TaxID=2987519 RepID=A0ABT9FU29_9BACL|nr:bis(5'-nucleosyl)-tetraphosphatase (symmetrical) YqeK [Paenibacillus sp. P96]MDP4098218.1 bis(5'-nucleosyl)-tetraphosphatase (symmetrical) YqeK [Paenibacillus sp. P96]
MNSVLEPYVQGLKISEDLETDIKSFFLVHDDIETLDHTLKVANEAERVAKLYGLHPGKAKQAGLLHDISNVVPVSDMMHVAEELSLDILEEEHLYPQIIHQKLSKAMAAEIFNIRDREVLEAIECHTTLKPQSGMLDKVLFISDKISWELPGEHSYLLDIRDKVNDRKLIEGILIYLNHVWEQRDQLKLVHPWLISAREELLLVP